MRDAILHLGDLHADNYVMTSKGKRLLRSAIYGVLAQVFIFYVPFALHSATLVPWFCWNIYLALKLVGPVQNLSVWLLAAPIVGFMLGIVTYSTAIYHALRAVDVWRARRTALAEHA